MKGLLEGLLAFGIALGACDGGSTGAGDAGGQEGGADASGAAGVPGDAGGEGASSGNGGSGAFAGSAGEGGTAARGGGDPGGEGGGAGEGGASGAGGEDDGGGAGENGGDGGSTSGRGGGGSGGGGSGGAGSGGGGTGGRGPSCTAPEHCLEELGANPCGTWSCSTAGECVVESSTCVDRDGDGRGVGTTCACALDCDDNDADVTSTKTIPCCRTGNGTKTCADGVWQACSAGIPATAEACDGEDDDCDGVADNGLGSFSCGMGVCRVSVPACTGGVVATCTPGSPTSSVDGCNDLDDDCDGAVDEDCSNCLHVAPNGDDAAAAANNGSTPFRNVQPALDFAAAHPEGRTRVCVAGGASCGETASYAGPAGAELTMRNGIDLLGGYESTTWTRCTTTRLAPTTGIGVLFPEEIEDFTVLDGFAIDRATAATTTGVTVRGGRGVLLSNVRIEDGPLATTSYGVNVISGAEVRVFQSRIVGGRGTEESVGVRAVGARVFLEGNCDGAATGSCAWPGSALPTSCLGAAIVGWVGLNTENSSRQNNAVKLENAAGSRVEASSMCIHHRRSGTFQPAAVQVLGDAAGVVVRASGVALVQNAEDATTAGLRFDDCRGAAPWVVDNPAIVGVGTPFDGGGAAAIRAFGDCHPVIDSNGSIAVQASAASGNAAAIDCGTANTIASRCVVVKNSSVRTESTGGGRPSLSGTGVRCTGCVKVSRNSITGVMDTGGIHSCGGGCTVSSIGLSMSAADGLVDRNRISAGCTLTSATGMAVSGNVRVQNNDILGFSSFCTAAILRGPFWLAGLSVGQGLADIHSNYIDAGHPGQIAPIGGPTECSIRGISFSSSGGIVRNNRILSGSCNGGSTTTGGAFVETTASFDPGVFENNSFVSGYLNESTTRLSSEQVNALVDMTASGNIGSCASTGSVLTSGSLCIDAGTPTGAPLLDIDGDRRDGVPDIGPDEFSN